MDVGHQGSKKIIIDGSLVVSAPKWPQTLGHGMVESVAYAKHLLVLFKNRCAQLFFAVVAVECRGQKILFADGAFFSCWKCTASSFLFLLNLE